MCHLLDDFLGAEIGKEKGKFLNTLPPVFDKLGISVAPFYLKVH